MVQGSRRTGFADSALVRLLARLSAADIRPTGQSTAERLGQWLGWTDAIALSTVLNGAPASSASSRPRASDAAEERECQRVRSTLTAAIAEDSLFARATDATDSPMATDFAPYRQRYLARQQAMEVGIGPLRARLRSALAARSPAMAKLAAVDVVMTQALDAREHSLMAGVPAVLEKHFKRLRREAQDALETQAALDGEAAPIAWLDTFHRDVRDVLAAELDFRFQPVEGLLEALRTRQAD